MKRAQAVQWMQQRHLQIPALLISHYKELGLNDAQFTALLHVIQWKEEGVELPSPHHLAERMTADEQECSRLLNGLCAAGFLQIEEMVIQQRRTECILTDPLYEKLYDYLCSEDQQQEDEERRMLEGRLFSSFEEEFARPLTPMEMEMISMWLDEDGHSPQLIEGALREAVISSKINFRYVDRILHEWKRSGIQTLDQAKEHGESVRRHHKKKAPQQSSVKPAPGYNWLEGGSSLC
ncbi:DnaD domain-containing protein [Alkalicoccus chagannorensis]|uniref:DnaD domain-containing protein n=1 Tax=Alkalicoccus chagannorensis TaxID=427072 RepID=UPI00047E4792|nr:DnaD domain-containing protein [Alkalicoccus chagannorensis]